MIRRLLVVAAVTAFGAVALQQLADATRNEDDPREPGTVSEIVIDVRTRRSDPDLAAQGLWSTCHLTIPFADVVEPLAPALGGGGGDDEGRYSVAVTPSLGQHDRRRLRGCLRDGTVDRAWADVVSISGAEHDRDDPDDD